MKNNGNKKGTFTGNKRGLKDNTKGDLKDYLEGKSDSLSPKGKWQSILLGAGAATLLGISMTLHSCKNINVANLEDKVHMAGIEQPADHEQPQYPFDELPIATQKIGGNNGFTLYDFETDFTNIRKQFLQGPSEARAACLERFGYLVTNTIDHIKESLKDSDEATKKYVMSYLEGLGYINYKNWDGKNYGTLGGIALKFYEGDYLCKNIVNSIPDSKTCYEFYLSRLYLANSACGSNLSLTGDAKTVYEYYKEHTQKIKQYTDKEVTNESATELFNATIENATPLLNEQQCINIKPEILKEILSLMFNGNIANGYASVMDPDHRIIVFNLDREIKMICAEKEKNETANQINTTENTKEL